MNEKWSQKYKRSIDCNNPKGFSQKAHCQGRKKNEMRIEEKLNLFLEKNCPTDPEKWSASKSAAKRKFDVYPSAYANGWAAKNYKSKGGGWKKCGKNESYDTAMGGWVEPSNKVAIENPFSDEDKLDEGGCWEGYKQVGMKEKNGRMVPNCVPVNETIKKVDNKYVVYPKKGGKRLGTHDTLKSAQKQLAAIEINKEAYNPKNDFMIAMSGEKPAEVFRVYAELTDGRVGISAWYTKNVINDFVADVKKSGAKILKIEKQKVK